MSVAQLIIAFIRFCKSHVPVVPPNNLFNPNNTRMELYSENNVQNESENN